MTLHSAASFEEAVALFNARRFFECHEVLEDLWRPLPAGPEKQFLQGLLQVGVGFHHLRNHNYLGTKNLLQAGLEKLEAVAHQSIYRPAIDLPMLLLGTQRAFQCLLELGPDQLAEFPDALIPKVQFLKPL